MAGEITIGLAETAAREPKVRLRRVFYIPGFDPLPPRRYRELYRREAARQAEISGYQIDVSGQGAAWQATLRQGAQTSRAEIQVLAWDDLVRAAISPVLTRLYGQMARTLRLYVSSGAARAMLRLRPGPLIAGLGQAALMVVYLLYAGAIGWAVALFAAQAGAPPVADFLAGLAGFGLAMRATWLFEEQMMTYFVISDLAHTASADGALPAEVDQRLEHFAAQIRAAMEDGQADEVLVIGHSSGAQMAVSALARARRGGARGRASLLTLGQTIPMTSFLPGARALRADLVAVADDPRVFWVDISAPADGVSFALTDPVATCRAGGRLWDSPLVLSAAFSRTLSKTAQQGLRWRHLRRHFQYLCAFDRPEGYDYFQITAGAETLRTRFAGRNPSPSMIAKPVAPVCHGG